MCEFVYSFCGTFLMIPPKNISWSIEYHHCYSYFNMGKTMELCVNLRQGIINFHKSENSYSTISSRLSIPRSTVQSVMKKFKLFGTRQNLPERERKIKLSPRTAQKLYRVVNINPRVDLKDIGISFDTMNIRVTTRTIQRCLSRNGLYENRPR